MGVKGLEYYIENFYPQARRKVSIIEIANKCREMQFGSLAGPQKRVPILAVDGMAVLRRLYKMDDLEWLYGGQWKQYVENFTTFVKRFRDEDIELVFFFDGKTEDSKEGEWISKRTEKLKDIQQVFQHMVLFNSYPDERLSQIPAGLDVLIRFALKRVCNCTVNAVIDAEQEIAKYALVTPNCFGILSQNSHYLIFDTKPYLSVAHLKLGSLETMQYERVGFAQHLGMTVCQLPMLSCLMGNNHVPPESLETLHSRLTSSNENADPEVLVRRLSEYVCYLGWTGNLNDVAKLIQISNLISVNQDILFAGLQFYSLLGMMEKPLLNSPYFNHYTRDRLKEKHQRSELVPFIYTLLMNQSFRSSECLEDQQSTGLMPSCLIYRPLRQHLYAVLFGVKEAEVEELSAIEGVPVLTEKVKPESFIVFGVQPTLDMLFHSYSANKPIRWRTLMTGMDLALSENQLQDIKHEHIGFACLLKYLLVHPVGDPRLLSWEVDALIAQAVSPLASDLDAIRDIQITYVEPRAVHLATIVLQGVSALLGFLQACRDPFSTDWIMPWNFFDGKLFHHLYYMAKRGATFEELLQHEKANVKAFLQLRSVVVSGTYIIKERYKEKVPATRSDAL